MSPLAIAKEARRAGRELAGRALNLARWLLGRKHYPWVRNPAQRVLGKIWRIAARGNSVVHRLVFMGCCALLKHRELVHADRLNYAARACGPVGQGALRNVLMWQLAALQDAQIPPTMRLNGMLLVSRDREEAQLDRLLSLVCASDALSSFAVFWDERSAVDSLPFVLTRAERHRWGGPSGCFDLNGPPSSQAIPAELEGVSRAIAVPLEAERAVSSYMKVAHPRAFVVAVSLPEDEDGFCDEALQGWLPYFRQFRAVTPGVAFCLLNRTTWGQLPGGSPLAAVAPVRSAGLGLHDALALARAAGAFLGCVDMFGLAALGAARPGVYMGATVGERADSERLIWHLPEATPEQCMTTLGEIVQRILERGPHDHYGH